MWQLVAIMATRALQILAKHRVAVGVGGAVAVTDITLDQLRQWAQDIAPHSDPVALEEAARTTMRVLGLSGDDVLWPHHRSGEPIVPQYFVLNLAKGQAWFSSKYYSRKSVQAGRRRGFSGGRGAGRRELVQNAQVSRG